MKNTLANAVQRFQVRRNIDYCAVRCPTMQVILQLRGQIAIQEGIHEIRELLASHLAHALSLDWYTRILRREEYTELYPSSSCRLSRADRGPAQGRLHGRDSKRTLRGVGVVVGWQLS